MEYGCIGERLPHSFSKEIHEKIGNYNYVLKELTPQELGSFMETRSFRAINVTIPYKQAVIPYLDRLDPAAAAIGAVNTVVNRNGKLYGYNTDLFGMEALMKREGIDLAGKKVLILGTGGTSKTAYHAANQLNAGKVFKVSRTAAEGQITYDEAVKYHADAQILINTTPVGMFPHIFQKPINVNVFGRLEAVVDAVYNPLKTQFVSAALKKGLKAQTGLYMLVAQAVRAYEIFMDTVAGAGTIDNVFHEIFLSKQNVVLTGMPSSGKTTVGKLLAKKQSRAFIDTDDLIVAKAGCSITDIFAKRGEAYFRALETQAIKEISMKSGCVIATGGGAVLNEENVEALKMNGKIFFLDRSPALLTPTEDRPLAASAEAVWQRYKERYPIYCRTADEMIPGDDTPEKVTEEIERRFFI